MHRKSHPCGNGTYCSAQELPLTILPGNQSPPIASELPTNQLRLPGNPEAKPPGAPESGSRWLVRNSIGVAWTLPGEMVSSIYWGGGDLDRHQIQSIGWDTEPAIHVSPWIKAKYAAK